MGLTVSENSGSSFKSAPAGTHVARCIRLIDIGNGRRARVSAMDPSVIAFVLDHVVQGYGIARALGAALLHAVTHIPFGHTLEDELQDVYLKRKMAGAMTEDGIKARYQKYVAENPAEPPNSTSLKRFLSAGSMAVA